MTKYTSIAIVALLLTAAVIVGGTTNAQTTQYTDSQGNVHWRTVTANGEAAGVSNPNGIAGVSANSTSSGTVAINTTITGSPVQTLYNQSGMTVTAFNSSTGALTPGWYYNAAGQPLYYYANGVYYDPSTQSYGGSIVYPSAAGPQSLATTGAFTPGVPNTGLGGNSLTMWLALLASAAIAVLGVRYLARGGGIS